MQAAFPLSFVISFNPVSKVIDIAVISAFQRKRLSNTPELSNQPELEPGFEPRQRYSNTTLYCRASQMWSLGQQHEHCLGTSSKSKRLNQILWGEA